MSDNDLKHVREHVLREGAGVAYRALLDVAADKKAPAPARATAGVAILRAAGLFSTSADGAHEKEPHEMSPEELSAAVAKMRAQIAEHDRRAATPGDHGLFD